MCKMFCGGRPLGLSSTHLTWGASIFMCKKSFRTQHNLKWHLCTCAEYCPFSCDVCKKFFSNQGNMKLHLCADNGECPFSVICKTLYTFRSIWNVHLCAHTGLCVNVMCARNRSGSRYI
jgi:hypothetical protein